MKLYGDNCVMTLMPSIYLLYSETPAYQVLKLATVSVCIESARESGQWFISMDSRYNLQPILFCNRIKQPSLCFASQYMKVM